MTKMMPEKQEGEVVVGQLSGDVIGYIKHLYGLLVEVADLLEIADRPADIDELFGRVISQDGLSMGATIALGLSYKALWEHIKNKFQIEGSLNNYHIRAGYVLVKSENVLVDFMTSLRKQEGATAFCLN